MRVRDGPAAVRGDAPAPKCHWPQGREGGAGGSPESEDLPLASKPEPLAEGGFVSRRFCIFVVALVAALLRRSRGVRRCACTCAWRARRDDLRLDRADARRSSPTRSTRSTRPAWPGEFYYHVADRSFGRYVDQIGRYSAGRLERLGLQGERRLAAGRRRRGHAQGRRPRALVLGDLRPDRRAADALRCAPGRSATATGCWRRTTRARRRPRAGARLHVGGRSVLARTGSACLGAHRGLVTATLTGAVRSNAIR